MTQTIFKTEFGSRLYGTDTPSSDIDWKGVVLPESRDILLGTVDEQRSTGDKVDDRSGHQRKNRPGELDSTAYSLKKFLSDLAGGRIHALDMLFATPLVERSIIHGEVTPEWMTIWENRERFFFRRDTRFVSYMRKQADRYGIKGSRLAATRGVLDVFRALLDQHGPSPRLRSLWAELGTKLLLDNPHVAIRPKMVSRGAHIGTESHLSVCGKKVSLNASLKTAVDLWEQLLERQIEANRRAETGHGIDWKALSHAVRVGRQAVELFESGDITFPRPERGLLLRIKNGELAYEHVAEEIESLLDEVCAAAERSILPDGPDRAWINDFVVDAYRRHVVADAANLLPF